MALKSPPNSSGMVNNRTAMAQSTSPFTCGMMLQYSRGSTGLFELPEAPSGSGNRSWVVLVSGAEARATFLKGYCQ